MTYASTSKAPAAAAAGAAGSSLHPAASQMESSFTQTEPAAAGGEAAAMRGTASTSSFTHAHGSAQPSLTRHCSTDGVVRRGRCSSCTASYTGTCWQSCWDPSGRILYTQGSRWEQQAHQAHVVSAGVLLPAAQDWEVHTSVACVGFNCLQGSRGWSGSRAAGLWGTALGGRRCETGQMGASSSRVVVGAGAGTQQLQHLRPGGDRVVHAAIGCCPTSFMCDPDTADLLVGTACGKVQWWS